jgi:integrase/recombinase XerD
MAELLYSTGIRRGELVGLDVGDVDFERRAITVRCGKGRRSRMVPVGHRALEWLARYVSTARRQQLRHVTEVALFLSRGGMRISEKTVTTRMRARLVAAGITKRGSCHVFRHSAATLMHDAGADIRDLQALLGHALLTSTQLYTRVSVARLHEVHARTHPAERGYTRTLVVP